MEMYESYQHIPKSGVAKLLNLAKRNPGRDGFLNVDYHGHSVSNVILYISNKQQIYKYKYKYIYIICISTKTSKPHKQVDIKGVTSVNIPHLDYLLHDLHRPQQLNGWKTIPCFPN